MTTQALSLYDIFKVIDIGGWTFNVPPAINADALAGA
jgi:hypothetical protein